eukprot:SAG22_NODE_1047_length_5859_cov_2.126042_2_plen_343_part_00
MRDRTRREQLRCCAGPRSRAPAWARNPLRGLGGGECDWCPFLPPGVHPAVRRGEWLWVWGVGPACGARGAHAQARNGVDARRARCRGAGALPARGLQGPPRPNALRRQAGAVPAPFPPALRPLRGPGGQRQHAGVPAAARPLPLLRRVHLGARPHQRPRQPDQRHRQAWAAHRARAAGPASAGSACLLLGHELHSQHLGPGELRHGQPQPDALPDQLPLRPVLRRHLPPRFGPANGSGHRHGAAGVRRPRRRGPGWRQRDRPRLLGPGAEPRPRPSLGPQRRGRDRGRLHDGRARQGVDPRAAVAAAEPAQRLTAAAAGGRDAQALRRQHAREHRALHAHRL